MIKNIALFAVLACSGFAQAQKQTTTVIMKSISYDPKVVSIKAGDSVVWENKSYTDHSATADDGTFDTGMIEPNKKSKALKFDHPGTYKFHCRTHGMSMAGQIMVTQ